MNSAASDSSEPQRFRFVVRSAEEAVTVLRERFGSNARVVSVRQVEGAGLARFLQAPKLEVIAEVVGEVPAPMAEAVVASEPNLTAPEPSIEAAAAPISSIAELEMPTLEEPPRAADVGGALLPRLLTAAGLSPQLIARLRNEPAWRGWESAQLRSALAQIARWLREEWQKAQREPLGQRVAFLGSPGAGKTTALCKQLAFDVFVRQRRAVVLKLDLDHANPGDGLAVVCEALGATFARDIAEVPALGPDDVLYVDVPGIAPGDESQTAMLDAALGPLFLSDRVLVANAAYESALLKRAFAWGEQLGCSRSVFTHLDELTHWGKLWDFLLHPALAPLFLSTGQNVPGDFELEIFETVLARTFPAVAPQSGTTSAFHAAA